MSNEPVAPAHLDDEASFLAYLLEEARAANQAAYPLYSNAPEVTSPRVGDMVRDQDYAVWGYTPGGRWVLQSGNRGASKSTAALRQFSPILELIQVAYVTTAPAVSDHRGGGDA